MNKHAKAPAIEIKLLQQEDIPLLVSAFKAANWPKSSSLFEQYLAEQQTQQRLIWVAYQNGNPAGYVTLKWRSDYPPFQENHIPEIADFNILPQYRRQGVGTLLLNQVETIAFEQAAVIGIGVGLYADYGAAQRLYILRGYVPNGLGVTYQYQVVKPGENVCLDDNLILWFTKKRVFIADINNEMEFDRTRMVKALTPREWETLRHFRQYYFFDKASITDPYTWTFNHEKHDHLVLYKGSMIIGYAHLQRWPEARAALRIIVIDESHRNQGLGSQFLQQIERWLKQQGIEKLQVQSSPEAYLFYCKNNYIKMPFNDPDHHESCDLDIDMGKIL